MARWNRFGTVPLPARIVSRGRLRAAERARRSRLHLRVGERQQAAYGDRALEIASELARHFEQGRNFERSLHHREQAARNALRRSAPREAIEHLSAGLDILGRLPEGHERLEHELQLRLALGAALQAPKATGHRKSWTRISRPATCASAWAKLCTFFPR
jgi:hypothetical protein